TYPGGAAKTLWRKLPPAARTRLHRATPEGFLSAEYWVYDRRHPRFAHPCLSAIITRCLACFAPGVSFAPGIASANRTVTAIAFADGETSRLREFSRGSARRPVRLARPARRFGCFEMWGGADGRAGRDGGPNVQAIRKRDRKP